MGKLYLFLTGGQSDFLIPLSHQWHGINVAPPLMIAAIIGAIGCAVYLTVALYRAARRRPAVLGAFLTALVYATAAYAASSTLSGLSAGGAISDTDLFYDVQTGGVGGVKVTGLQLKTYIQASVVTSIATGCQATGGTITTTGTISTSMPSNVQTGAGYTLLASDCGKIIVLSNAAAQTLTLNNFSTGNFVDVVNKGAGTWILAAGTGALNSGCSAIAQYQSVRIQFDGTNWNVACGSSIQVCSGAPMIVAGNFYNPFASGGSAQGGANVAGTMYFTPFCVQQPITIDQLCIRVGTGGGGVTPFAMAIYANSGNNPGALLSNTAGSTSTSTGVLCQNLSSPGATLSITTPGWYWVAYQAGDTTQRVWIAIASLNGETFGPTVGSSNSTNVFFNSAILAIASLAGTPGTWPNPATAVTFNNTTGPMVAYHVLSSP